MGGRTDGVINDTQFDVRADGTFEVLFGGPTQPRNWIALPADASRITTRHYYEEETAAAADPNRHPALSIECSTTSPPRDAAERRERGRGPAPRRELRARAHARDAAAGQARSSRPSWPPRRTSSPRPCTPGDLGLAAFDAAYSMAPYVLAPDQALVIRGRWPTCRCANVDLWNRFQQTYDYSTKQVTLNRKQTKLDADGSFRIVIAHRDPGVPNWLDTEGRPFGMVFWRFFLPEGAIETPRAEVVPVDEVARR